MCGHKADNPCFLPVSFANFVRELKSQTNGVLNDT